MCVVLGAAAYLGSAAERRSTMTRRARERVGADPADRGDASIDAGAAAATTLVRTLVSG